MDARVKTFEEKMQKTVDFLGEDFMTIRAGRANPHVLDKIKVDYYGTPTPLQQVGNITVPEPRMIQIAPWEKSLIKEIEKAILCSDVGITPSNDGSVIRLVFPELTEERRKDLVKEVKKKGEESKVAVRNSRRDGNDSFKKLAKEDVSEDEIKRKVAEAEQYAEEDKKRKEEVDLRNRAEALIYDTEKSLKELEGKISDDEKTQITDAKECTESYRHYIGWKRQMGKEQGNAT